jgi:hypothetical protein
VSDRAAADALFEEGMELRNAGDHAAACDRFERSQSLDPALGTLQNIGMCLQKQGKLVAALSRFQTLLTEAEGAGDDERIRIARAKLRNLRRRVPKLHISLPSESEISGLKVFVNGDRLQDALLGATAPVDPGSYTVSASAPDHADWSQTVELETRQKLEVVIPKLEKLEETVATSEGSAAATSNTEVQTGSGPAGPSVGEHSGEGESIRASLSFGPSFLSLGDLDLATQAAATAEGSWRLRGGDTQIEVGGLVSLTAFFWAPPQGEAKRTKLVSLLGNVTVSHEIRPGWSLRAQGGLGLLVLMGLDELDHPLLKPGVTSAGVVNLPQVRVAIGGEFEVRPSLRLVVNPLVYWYSPGSDGFAQNIDSLSGLQSMAGVSYLF